LTNFTKKYKANMATLRLGDIAPDFYSSRNNNGECKEWIGDSWCVLFSHPGHHARLYLLNWELLQHFPSLKRKTKAIALCDGRVAYKMD
jgi:hypothetical protein